MKVLVACEFSGIVRDAFRDKGHFAVSCDLLPSERPLGVHFQGDVIPLLDLKWDMLIAFPPCTALCVSGNGTYADSKEREDAVEFFRLFLEAPISRRCVENPVGVISTRLRPPDQYIQPHEYGEDASKKTGLWLAGLPLLVPTKRIDPRMVEGLPRWSNQTNSGQNRLGPSPTRGKERGRTYEGIALAMAEQWG